MTLYVSDARAEFIHGLVVGEDLGFVRIEERPAELADEEGSWAWAITDEGLELVTATAKRVGKHIESDDLMFSLLVSLGRLSDEDGLAGPFDEAWENRLTATIRAVRGGR